MELTRLETFIGLIGLIKIVTANILAVHLKNKQVNSCEDLQNPQIRICGSLQHAGGVSLVYKAFPFTCQTTCQSLKQANSYVHCRKSVNREFSGKRVTRVALPVGP